jgi:hypothetical protein
LPGELCDSLLSRAHSSLVGFFLLLLSHGSTFGLDSADKVGVGRKTVIKMEKAISVEFGRVRVRAKGIFVLNWGVWARGGRAEIEPNLWTRGSCVRWRLSLNIEDVLHSTNWTMATPQVRAEAGVDAGVIAQAMKTPGLTVSSAGGVTVTVKAIYMEDVLNKLKDDNNFHDMIFPGDDALKDASAAFILKSHGFPSKFESFPGDNTMRLVSTGGPASPIRTSDIVFDVQVSSPSPEAPQGL